MEELAAGLVDTLVLNAAAAFLILDKVDTLAEGQSLAREILLGGALRAWLDKAQAGDFEGAWRTLVRDNPLPAIIGRTCPHPCEQNCTLAPTGNPIAIASSTLILMPPPELSGATKSEARSKTGSSSSTNP
mgnify:CR=1 FL=1